MECRACAATRLTLLADFGNCFLAGNYPNGTCIRDYVHVCDLVNAHFLELNWIQAGRGSWVFNSDNGDGFFGTPSD